jgi:hypothetical protein
MSRYGRKMPKGYLERIRELHAQGLSTSHIAEVLRRDRTTIRHHLLQMNLEANLYPQELKPIVTFTCPQCNSPFQTKNYRQTCCGKSCAASYGHKSGNKDSPLKDYNGEILNPGKSYSEYRKESKERAERKMFQGILI